MKRIRKATELFWDRWSHKLQRLLGQLTPVIAFLLIGLAYFLGIRTERTGFVAEVLDPNLKKITQPVLNAFRGKPPTVPRLVVSMAQDRRDSLLIARENALEAGWLYPEENPRFPVQCRFGDFALQGVLNLRDGPAEDLALQRWPLHLRVADGDTIFGMQTMEMLPVHDIQALTGWLMQQALVEQGQLNFGHAMLELRMNSMELGLYTLEGRTDSTLLHKWGRGRGPVMRFDDELLTSARAAMDNRLFNSLPPPQGDWLVAPIMAARNALMLADPITADRYQNAVDRLEELRAGKSHPSDVFEIEGMAKLFALADILGGQSSMAWWNLRFLADSTSDRLIVIPQRIQAGRPIEGISALQLNGPLTFSTGSIGFQDRLFNDSIFYRHYLANLDTFSGEGWLEGFFDRMAPGIEERERIIKAEYPQEVLDTNIFHHNRTVIEQTLRPKDLVLAYTQSVDQNRRRLALANVHALPIEAVAVVSGTDTFPLAKAQILLPRELDKPLTYTLVNTRIPKREGQPEHLLVRVLGLPDLRSVTIKTWSTFVAN
ncbi:MAG: hypothetical protein M3R08_05325 [Bacteroidota bacterium]|nr:hypothetical protein [Bacteroidota bacterium]